jgi:endonuclease/exonuclease/phosphatase family metal-dependent hydrolase/dienelactone hydrolase
MRYALWIVCWCLLGLTVAMPVRGQALAGVGSAEVKVTRDIAYGAAPSLIDGTQETLRLDLYQPTGEGTALRPALVIVHGGGFTRGDKRNGALVSLARDAARRGYVAVSINYRLFETKPTRPTEYLKPLADFKAAVRFVRKNAEAWGVDVDRVACLGSSAGAYLCLAGAYSDSGAGESGNPGLRDDVQAVVDLWGALRLTRAIEADEAPLLIIHGTEDTVVPFSAAEALRARAEEIGLPHVFLPLEGEGHSPWRAFARQCQEPMFEFLREHLKLSELAQEADAPLRAMTFNIRYDNAGDGENRWSERRDLVVKTIADYGPDVLGLQEALKHQLDYVLEKLPRYESLGVGRDDGEAAGEFSALLYDPKRFECLESGTFWLSDTPTVPGSRSWGNGIPRICTWARLRDLASERVLLVYNAHLDHRNQPSRHKGLELIAARAAGELGGESEDGDASPRAAAGLVVMGDFNASELSNEIRFILAAKSIGVVDTYRVLHRGAKYAGTFNGFEGTADGAKIDYVLANGALEVVEAAIVREHDAGRYPSDHFPVTATLRWGE